MHDEIAEPWPGRGGWDGNSNEPVLLDAGRGASDEEPEVEGFGFGPTVNLQRLANPGLPPGGGQTDGILIGLLLPAVQPSSLGAGNLVGGAAPNANESLLDDDEPEVMGFVNPPEPIRVLKPDGPPIRLATAGFAGLGLPIGAYTGNANEPVARDADADDHR